MKPRRGEILIALGFILGNQGMPPRYAASAVLHKRNNDNMRHNAEVS
jgi:hypothetical protein